MATRHTTRPKVPRAVREPQMLDEALRVFAQRGYHGASMADIAAGAGVTKPMVYAYFGSKDDLYLRCIDHAAARLMAAFDIAPDDNETLDETMWRRILAYFRFVGDHRDELARRLRPGRGDRQPVQQARRAGAAPRRRAGRRPAGGGGPPGTRRQDLEPMAEAIVGAGEALGDWWVEHPEESAEAMALREMNLIWMGLGGLLRGEYWTPPAVASSA